MRWCRTLAVVVASQVARVGQHIASFLLAVPSTCASPAP